MLGGGLGQDLANTALFLRAQGKVDRILVTYLPFLDPAYVRRDAQKQGL